MHSFNVAPMFRFDFTEYDIYADRVSNRSNSSARSDELEFDMARLIREDCQIENRMIPRGFRGGGQVMCLSTYRRTETVDSEQRENPEQVLAVDGENEPDEYQQEQPQEPSQNRSSIRRGINYVLRSLRDWLNNLVRRIRRTRKENVDEDLNMATKLSAYGVCSLEDSEMYPI